MGQVETVRLILAFVLSTLLSGLEVEVLNITEYMRLERLQMCRLRCLLRGRAYGRSNQDVRALLSRPALWSILAARRLIQSPARQLDILDHN
eukprot:11031954-Heterocapsa_arctica.AAC.1